jgi:hypothetical protein
MIDLITVDTQMIHAKALVSRLKWSPGLHACGHGLVLGVWLGNLPTWVPINSVC